MPGRRQAGGDRWCLVAGHAGEPRASAAARGLGRYRRRRHDRQRRNQIVEDVVIDEGIEPRVVGAGAEVIGFVANHQALELGFRTVKPLIDDFEDVVVQSVHFGMQHQCF